MTNEEIVTAIQRNPQYTTPYMAMLWDQNIAFVRQTAARYAHRADIDDLMQCGYIGLHKAVQHFDPDAGKTFIGYAFDWIRTAMQRGAVGVSICSLDEPVTEDGNITRADLLIDEDEDPAQDATDGILAASIWSEVERLDPLPCSIVESHYRDGMELKDVAVAHGMPYQRTHDELRRARAALARNPRLLDIAENYGLTSRLAYSSGRSMHSRFQGSTVERIAEGREGVLLAALEREKSKETTGETDTEY